MRAIHKVMEDHFICSDKEPGQWSVQFREDFAVSVLFAMTESERSQFREDVFAMVPEDVNPIQTKAFNYEYKKAAIGYIFCEQHIEIIRGYTYSGDDDDDAVKRSDDQQARYNERVL